jgi:NitT/TauT family transport system substrate-binding protein
MLAYVRGARDYKDAVTKGQGRDAILDILAEYSAVKDRGVLEKIVLPDTSADPFVNRESVARDVAAYTEWGTVTEPVALDRLLDNQWVQYAVDRLGPYQ